jgi:sulfite exporter TauE/SafE
LYSIPRVLVLTAFGALVGGGGFILSGSLEGIAIPVVQAVVYMVIGALMITNGLSFRRDKGACRGSSPGDRLIARLAPRFPSSEKRYMFTLGALFSLVCLGEAWGIMGLASVSAALESGSVLSASALGAFYMFAFSIGLTVPPMVLGSMASEAGRRNDLAPILKAGGSVLIILGSLILIYEVMALATITGII